MKTDPTDIHDLSTPWMRSTTQPPKTQKLIADLLAPPSRAEYDDHRAAVDAVAVRPGHGTMHIVAPARGTPLDGVTDMPALRDEIAWHLVRDVSVHYGHVDTALWTRGAPVPALTFDVRGGPCLQLTEVPADLLAQAVSSVRAQGPSTGQTVRMVLQRFRPELHIVFAAELDDWVDQFRETGISWTCLAVDVAVRASTAIVMQAKGLAGVARPTDPFFDPPPAGPRLAVPNYSAYPGGHAAIASAVATVLAHIRSPAAGAVALMALDIQRNRELALLHTEVDTQGGRELGKFLGAAMLNELVARVPKWRQLLELAQAEW
jgi:hypothetical protein